MKTNPEAYKDLLGKKLIFAYLYMGDGKGGRVENIKEATLDIRRREITKITIFERKNDWQEIAYFDTPDRYYNYTITACKKDDLRRKIENFRNTAANYTYYDNQDDYYCGDIATYYTLDEGQTDEEIRAILEEKVKEEFENEVQAVEERIARLKEKVETLKNFMK
jgi:4-alpha-glucanotransferase